MSFDVDLSLARGGRTIAVRFASDAGTVSLFGPSGAGKTSVLDMVAGLLRPTRGRVVIGGHTLFDATAGINLPPEARAVGYVPQEGSLFPHRRVRDNLLFGWHLAAPERRHLTLAEVANMLDIAHMLDRMPATLSGGEGQRVAIGRALLAGPRVLLLDEPLASLDAARAHETLRLIERLRSATGLPLLHVSHDRAEVDRLGGLVVEMAR